MRDQTLPPPPYVHRTGSSMKDGRLDTLRGRRMLRWTITGHPVTFSWVEVGLAAWKALWLPGYFLIPNFAMSINYLSNATAGLIPPWLVAIIIGGIGIAHVAIMMSAWFGITRPHRCARLWFNCAAVVIYSFISGVALSLEAWTTAGPYVLFVCFALANLQRAIRNGRGYRALP